MKKRKHQAETEEVDESSSSVVREMIDKGGAAEAGPEEKKDDTPAYGSQKYWEKRYKRNQRIRNSATATATTASKHNDSNHEATKNNDEDEDGCDDDDNSDGAPGHEWYFTYQELKSLILPLILGGRGDEYDQWSDGVDDNSEHEGEDGCDDDDDGWEEVEEENEDCTDEDDIEKDNNNSNLENKEDNNDTKEDYTIEGKDDDDINKILCHECYDNYENKFKGLAESNSNSTQPKKILEIGCGDVPLGRDILQDLLTFQSNTGANANRVVDQIVCFDYSTVVIDLLSQEQKQNEKDTQEMDLRVKYEVYDARNLPFKENEFHLILEKGTLDAMLVDKDEGTENCIQIVSEAARLLACGGRLILCQYQC